MKKFLTLAMIAFLGGTLWASSPNNNNPFQDDLSRIESEFAGMTELENVVENRNATYSELAAENNALLQNVTSDNDIAASLLGSAAPSGDRLLGIPGFWWGFCLGLLGIILVYVAVEGDAKKTEGKKAIIGCAVWTVIWVVLWFGLFASSAWWATAG
jgi:hypothetical protein